MGCLLESRIFVVFTQLRLLLLLSLQLCNLLLPQVLSVHMDAYGIIGGIGHVEDEKRNWEQIPKQPTPFFLLSKVKDKRSIFLLVFEKTSTLAGKFGNAIPISNIEEQNEVTKNVICQIQIVPTPENPDITAATSQQEPPQVISLSSFVECVEIQLDSQTPEFTQAWSQQKDEVLKSPVQTIYQKESPPLPAQQERAISSRYVIDTPPQTTTPDADFLKSFDSAMNILKEISPIKNSMTFQRECQTSNNQPSSRNAVKNLQKTPTEDPEK